jgi:hypothetical protein
MPIINHKKPGCLAVLGSDKEALLIAHLPNREIISSLGVGFVTYRGLSLDKECEFFTSKPKKYSNALAS